MFANLFEDIYDVLTRPNFALYRISHRDSYRESIAVFILIGVLSSLPNAGGFTSGVGSVIILSLLGSALMLLFGSALLHLAAVLLGGEGDIRGLLRALPFASFPYTFLAFTPLLGVFSGEWAISLIGFLGTLTTVWVFFLQIVAVSQNYAISKIRSFFAMLLPFIILFSFFLFIFFAAIFAMMQGIMTDPAIMQTLEQMEGVAF